MKEIKSLPGYSLYLGLSEDQLKEIVKYSNDESDKGLQENTGDKKRFADLEKAKSWLSDEWRMTYALVSDEGKIAWIWWGRKSKMPTIKNVTNEELAEKLKSNADKVHTSGYRLYPAFRGKWLAKVLLEAENHYKNMFPGEFMSIDIEQSNVPSLKAAIKAWYKELWIWENAKTLWGEPSERIIFVKEY